MHEHKFTEQIVHTVLDELNRHPETKPQSVEVSVGEVFHLEPESVLMHFGLLTRGTRLEGVDLHFSEVPLEVACRECGERGPVEDHHLPTCHSCGSLEVETIKGHHVDVQITESCP